MYKLVKLTRLPMLEGKVPLNSLSDKSLSNSLFQVNIIQDNTLQLSYFFLFSATTNHEQESTINNENSQPQNIIKGKTTQKKT